MARPRKIGLDYYPHDVDASTDPKIEPVVLLYGAAGYAFYFIHLDYCYRSDDFSIDISATETGQEMRMVIQKKMQIDSELYEKILQAYLRHKAFDADIYQNTGKLTSAGIQKRAAIVLEKRKREAERYKVSTPPLASAISAAETTAETAQSKEKKSKGNKSIEKKTTAPEGVAEPTLQERQFQDFWASYPKKVGKKDAQKAWKSAKVDSELFSQIMNAIGKAKTTEQWRREGGRFVPNPATWLNQGRWEDEYGETQSETDEHRATSCQNAAKRSMAESGFHLAGEDNQ
ncbi:MAG: DUF4373 domain-containing protein [Oscillospiraceae bacterium]|nr:DUF4373 domain-containing protein [Oscillospiraceae bacterium]